MTCTLIPQPENFSLNLAKAKDIWAAKKADSERQPLNERGLLYDKTDEKSGCNRAGRYYTAG